MEHILQCLLLICVLSASLVAQDPATQQDVDNIARDLKLQWTVDSNTIIFNKNMVHLIMINAGTRTFNGGDWEIFFDTPMMVEPGFLPEKERILQGQGIKLRHWTGTHYGMSPTADFIAMKPGAERKIKFHLSFWTISRTDSFPNWYIKFNGFEPRILTSTTTVEDSLDFVSKLGSPGQWKRATTDKLNPFTAQERYRRYHNEYTVPTAEKHIPIIPKPIYTDTSSSDSVIIDGTWQIDNTHDLTDEAEYLKNKMSLSIASTPPTTKFIKLRIGKVILPKTTQALNNDEAYHLVINAVAKTITITGKSDHGVFNGIQSLLASLSVDTNMVLTTTIVDEPRFSYRGMHIDVGRNFHPKDSILKLLDAMAMVKLNKLHFHLSDDEGWRLEIPGLPELTQIGAQRCFSTADCLEPQLGSGPFSTAPGSGHYTTTEYQDILRYANTRHIQVIPEFDMPGHARAAIKAMEKRNSQEYVLTDPDDTSKYWSVQFFNDNAINPCINSTYKFVSHVLDEVIKMHESIQPLTLYHYGGDEVGAGAWVNSSKCQASSENNTVSSDDIKKVFFRRVAEITGNKGLHLAAWEDGMMDKETGQPFDKAGLTSNDLYSYIWNNVWEWGGAPNANKFANAGFKVIMCPVTHVYFDHPYEPDPEERGYYWGPRFTNAKKTFSFMPGDIYSNIDFSRFGDPLTRAGICPDEKTCPPLTKPENVIGMQGHLWSETVRRPTEMEYMIFPRLLAIGERAWHKADWETISDAMERNLQINMDWARYSEAVGQRDLPRLDIMDIKYRVSPPGAKVQDGKLMTNTEYGGQTVVYSIDDGTSWKVATGNILVKDNSAILLKTRNKNGLRESRLITLYPDEPLPTVAQDVIDYIGDNLVVTYEVLENFDGVKPYLAQYMFTNDGKLTIPVGNWEIFFYSVYMVEPAHLEGHVPYEIPGANLILEHINGGLFKLYPTRAFGDFKPGEMRKFSIHVKYWSVSRSDVMPNMYVTAEGMSSKTITSTAGESLSWVHDFKRMNQWKRFNSKTVKDLFDPFTPNHRYTINEKVQDLGHNPNTIIPTPLEYILDNDNTLTLSEPGWKVVRDPRYSHEAAFLIDGMIAQGLPDAPITSTKPANKFVNIKFADPQVTHNGKTSMSPEAYSLNIEPDSQSIEITAAGTAGAFYGVQSLLSILRKSDGKVSKTIIKDTPRFVYRGMHLDVGRNFHSKTSVLKLLEAMSSYKLNKFHFHLSDDEGWRLEIPGLEELTKIGSKRCDDLTEKTCILPQLGSGPHDDTSGTGFYTVTDYKEILEFAAERHIEVIPEFDMPGHAHAAIKSMDARSERLSDAGDFDNAFMYLLHDPGDNSTYTSIQLFHDNSINPCLDTTYNFVQHIAQEVRALHQGINPLKVFHFGGDEVATGSWLKSPACAKLGNTVAISVDAMKEMFTTKVANLTNALGLNLAGWEDGLKKTGNVPFDLNKLANNKVYGYAWSNVWEWGAAPRAHIWANAGYKVVMAPATNYYFDHPYEPDPEERGFYWATRYTDTKKVFSFMPENLYANAEIRVSGAKITKEDFCKDKVQCPDLEKPENLVGIQGNLWSETIRTPQELDYMIFPRLLALAERAWHKSDWEDIEDKSARVTNRDNDWATFSNTLGYGEVRFLDAKNITYRVPPPGAKIIGDILYANSEIPGLKVVMSSDDGKSWAHVGADGVNVKGQNVLRLFTWSADEKRKSREISLTNLETTSGAATTMFDMSLKTVLLLVLNMSTKMFHL